LGLRPICPERSLRTDSLTDTPLTRSTKRYSCSSFTVAGLSLGGLRQTPSSP
jgi:hypothetical protein